MVIFIYIICTLDVNGLIDHYCQCPSLTNFKISKQSVSKTKLKRQNQYTKKYEPLMFLLLIGKRKNTIK